MKSSSKNISEGILCRSTLSAQDFSKKASFDLADINNACKTITHTIKVGKGDEYQTMHYLADKIARTWWIVHEGLIEDTWNRDGWFSGKQCNIVYVITIDKKKKLLKKNADLVIPKDTFLSFLGSTIYPPKKSENMTYADYIYEHKNVWFDVLPQKPFLFPNAGSDIGEIRSGESYAISLISKDPGSSVLPQPPITSVKDLIYLISPDKQLIFSTTSYAMNKLGCVYMQ